MKLPHTYSGGQLLYKPFIKLIRCAILNAGLSKHNHCMHVFCTWCHSHGDIKLVIPRSTTLLYRATFIYIKYFANCNWWLKCMYYTQEANLISRQIQDPISMHTDHNICSKNLKKQKGFRDGLSYSTPQKWKNQGKCHYPASVPSH